MIETSLAELRDSDFPILEYNRLVRGIQGKPFKEVDKNRGHYVRFKHERPIYLAQIHKFCGLDCALDVLRNTVGHCGEVRQFAVRCVRHFESHLCDERSFLALSSAERFAKGMESKEEMHRRLFAARLAATRSGTGAAWAAAWVGSFNARTAAMSAIKALRAYYGEEADGLIAMELESLCKEVSSFEAASFLKGGQPVGKGARA